MPDRRHARRGRLVGGLAADASAGASRVVRVTTIAGNGLKAAPVVTLSKTQLGALPQATATVSVDGTKLVEKGPSLTVVIATARLTSVTSCVPLLVRGSETGWAAGVREDPTYGAGVPVVDTAEAPPRDESSASTASP